MAYTLFYIQEKDENVGVNKYIRMRDYFYFYTLEKAQYELPLYENKFIILNDKNNADIINYELKHNCKLLRIKTF